MVASNLVLSVVSSSKMQNFHAQPRILSRMKNLHPPHTLTLANLFPEGREVLSKKRNFANTHNFNFFITQEPSASPVVKKKEFNAGRVQITHNFVKAEFFKTKTR